MKIVPSFASSSCPTREASPANEGSEHRIARLDGGFGGVSNQQNLAERRQHPRDGVVARLEDITYSILREYELIGVAA